MNSLTQRKLSKRLNKILSILQCKILKQIKEFISKNVCRDNLPQYSRKNTEAFLLTTVLLYLFFKYLNDKKEFG